MKKFRLQADAVFYADDIEHAFAILSAHFEDLLVGEKPTIFDAPSFIDVSPAAEAIPSQYQPFLPDDQPTLTPADVRAGQEVLEKLRKKDDK